MVFAYVIESLSDHTWYTGIAIDPLLQLKEHNNGKNRFTKGYLPGKIIFTEQHPAWMSAGAQEKYLKSAAGKKWLRRFIDDQNPFS